jgi:Kdo2-lipid IVA lauroyltransferase/acyltransferase
VFRSSPVQISLFLFRNRFLRWRRVRIIRRMSVKARKPYIDWLVYLAVRAAVCLVQALPTTAALGFANLLAKLAYRFDKRHRNVASENLAFAFPEKTATERDALVRACYQHFMTMVIEIAVLPRKLRAENWRKFATIIGGESIMRALLSDRPLLIVTAHFGNWELAGFALGSLGFRTHAIARVLDNPHLERFLKLFRERTGQKLIPKKDGFDQLNATLRQGGKVATLGDQDAGNRGVFIQFFGRPASAHKAVALMAIEYDAVMLVIGVPRVRAGSAWHYHVTCVDLIDSREYATEPDPVKTITQRYHNSLAEIIRRYPEQYFWLHRRWKSQPVQRVRQGKA